jgi:hypothetical protein
MSLRQRGYLFEESDDSWIVRVNERKVQWAPEVYDRYFGKGKRFAIVKASSAKEAIREFSAKARINSFYLKAEPKKPSKKMNEGLKEDWAKTTPEMKKVEAALKRKFPKEEIRFKKSAYGDYPFWNVHYKDDEYNTVISIMYDDYDEGYKLSYSESSHGGTRSLTGLSAKEVLQKLTKLFATGR